MLAVLILGLLIRMLSFYLIGFRARRLFAFISISRGETRERQLRTWKSERPPPPILQSSYDHTAHFELWDLLRKYTILTTSSFRVGALTLEAYVH